jgi:hypothetical protein
MHFLYIDPGTGSLIIQIILGTLASVWLIFKLFGQKIKKLLGIKPKNELENQKGDVNKSSGNDH